jgi:hypothetical protein
MGVYVMMMMKLACSRNGRWRKVNTWLKVERADGDTGLLIYTVYYVHILSALV